MEKKINKIKYKSGSGSKGFTLVEVMVAMSIFITIVTIGMTAVLNAISQHRATENIRTVMDNLNFVMEDMARNIRIGTNIRCVLPSDLPSAPFYNTTTLSIIPQNCPVGSNKIEFNGTGATAADGKFITYVVTSPLSSTPNVIFKQKGNDPALFPPQVITPPGVVMDFNRSGFEVRGAEAGDGGQPTVVIRLAGTINYQGAISDFAVQTTVALRGLDS